MMDRSYRVAGGGGGVSGAVPALVDVEASLNGPACGGGDGERETVRWLAEGVESGGSLNIAPAARGSQLRSGTSDRTPALDPESGRRVATPRTPGTI